MKIGVFIPHDSVFHGMKTMSENLGKLQLLKTLKVIKRF